MIRIDAAWLATAPLDMRAGIDTALARVVAVFGATHPHHAYGLGRSSHCLLASRRIVGWSMSGTIDAKPICAALRSAYWQRKPGVGLLVYTDRGSQYASHEYRRLAADFGITMSMSRKGNAWDNAAMGSFFKTMKVEASTRYAMTLGLRLVWTSWTG